MHKNQKTVLVVHPSLFLSLFPSFSLFFSLSPSFSLFLSLSPSFSLFPSLHLCLAISFFLFLSLSLYLSLPLLPSFLYFLYVFSTGHPQCGYRQQQQGTRWSKKYLLLLNLISRYGMTHFRVFHYMLMTAKRSIV
jgi:hypothetical protein